MRPSSNALFVAACCAAAQAGAEPLPAATVAAALALVREAAAASAPAGARIEAVAGTLDSRLRLAACGRIEAAIAPGTRPWGRTRVGLRCTQGETPWSVSLPVTVHVFAPALTAAAGLAAGTLIDAGHLRTAEVDWAAESSPVHTQGSALTGRTLLRPLMAGQAFRGADVRPRQWFAAGDTVRIVANGAGFAISTSGQALSNGFEGQPARVRTDGGRLVSGQPVGERRVEVAL